MKATYCLVPIALVLTLVVTRGFGLVSMAKRQERKEK